MFRKSSRRARSLFTIVVACVLGAWLISAGLRSTEIDWIPAFWAWATLISAVLCICMGISMALRQDMHSRDKADNIRILGFLMLVCFCAGAYLFGRAFRSIDLASNVPMTTDEAFLRSMICSFKLFVLDLSGFVYSKIGNTQLKSFITLQAAASFTCTMLLLWSLVASRLRAWIRLLFTSVRFRPRRRLYIFFGINPRSIDMAREVRKEHGRNEADIIFIERSRVDSNEGKGMARLTDMLTHKREYFELADSLDAHISLASKGFEDIGDDSGSVLTELGLPLIRRIVRRTIASGPDASIHLFLLNDDSDTNISRLMTLSHDPLFHNSEASASDPVHTASVNIYLRCCDSPSTASLAFLGLTRRMNVKVIDDARLAVDMLRLNGDAHPVHQIMPGPGTTVVNSPFEALVIGFGATGREATRFLYEFGAFADADGNRSPFRLTAIDPAMNRLAPSFKISAPAIFANESSENSSALRLIQTDADSDLFIKGIFPEIAQSLHYVVIAFPDEYEAIELAGRLLDDARRAGTDISRLRIEVRCYDSEKYPYMIEVASLYNNGTGTDAIHIFGSPDSLYTYDKVVRQRLIEMGRQYYAGYARCLQQLLNEKSTSWEVRRLWLTGFLNRQKVHGEYVYTPAQPPLRQSVDRLRELFRKESQDIANALHIPTKAALMRNALGNLMPRFSSLPDPEEVVSSEYGASTHSGPTDWQKTALQLARLEHVRWVASLQLAGYAQAPEEIHCADDSLRLHNCLIDWSRLDDEAAATGNPYKLYDLMVIYTTLQLMEEDERR